MPGKGHRFTAKQDRQAKHIADMETHKHPGMPRSYAESIGYATVNKQKSKAKK